MMFDFLLTPYLALFLRIVIGATLIMHGYPKLKNPKAILKWTESLGVPKAATIAAIVLEFFGGIALIIGFMVPVIAFFIALEMIGNIALKKTKMKAPYLIGQNASAYEPDVTYILLAMTLMVLGAGIFSISPFLPF